MHSTDESQLGKTSVFGATTSHHHLSLQYFTPNSFLSFNFSKNDGSILIDIPVYECAPHIHTYVYIHSAHTLINHLHIHKHMLQAVAKVALL